MTTGDDQLIREMARRNWLILCVMVLGSLLWKSLPVTVGVLGGGLVVIASFHALHRSLKRLLLTPGQKSGLAFQGGTLVRLLCLAGAIFVLIGPLKAPPLALAAGLSVVVANLLWTTVSRSLSW
ncbi:MAG: ATP synthase subunit I [Pedobacter sp.]